VLAPAAVLELCDVESDPLVALAKEKAQKLQDASVYGAESVVNELCRSPRVQMYIDEGVGESQMTALMSAAQAGRVDTARVLLAAGADPNVIDRQGRSALMLAAASGESLLFEPLIESGADVSLRATIGWNALCFACGHGQTEAAAELISLLEGRGEPRDDLSLQSALGVAREQEHAKAIELLEAALEGCDMPAALQRAKEKQQL